MPDTKPRERSFIPYPHELTWLLKERSGIVVRPVEPQPDRVLAPVEIAELCAGVRVGEIRCPFGVCGDRLWIRETWTEKAWTDAECVRSGCPDAAQSSETYLDVPLRAIYRASYVEPKDAPGLNGIGPWRPSTNMPRWASRRTVEVVSVRVVRVQEISEDDIDAAVFHREHPHNVEGPHQSVCRFHDGTPDWCECGGYSLTELYAMIWNSLYASKGIGWDEKPWAWMVGWRTVE